jgi:hypothetical protein
MINKSFQKEFLTINPPRQPFDTSALLSAGFAQAGSPGAKYSSQRNCAEPSAFYHGVVANEAGFLIIFLFQRTYTNLPKLTLGLFSIFSFDLLLCEVMVRYVARVCLLYSPLGVPRTVFCR